MNFIFFIVYEILLWIVALIALPKIIYSLVFRKKYRSSLFQRFGFGFPISQNTSHPAIWVHAVSVGETKAVVSLARDLKQRFPNNPLIISSVTETGHAEAKRSLPFADAHVFFPLDFSFIVNRIIKLASPGLVILCESDFWFNFLKKAKKHGAAVVLVNGKISEKSMRRFGLFSFFSRRLFSLFDLLCLQNALYRGRFIEAGAESTKIVITGNLKLDEDHPRLTVEEGVNWRSKLGIEPGQIVLTAGSTHSPEEELILNILKKIWEDQPQVRLILVPRHPERFREVGRLLDKENIRWIKFSDIQRRDGSEQVVLMDAMGLLRMCYQLSDIAIVGGSFTSKVGGHNILEPCWYGKPVLFGPYMHTQHELLELIMRYRAGKQVKQEQLYDTLTDWIKHPQKREEIGMKGLQLVKDLRGSTARTMQALTPFLAALKEK